MRLLKSYWKKFGRLKGMVVFPILWYGQPFVLDRSERFRIAGLNSVTCWCSGSSKKPKRQHFTSLLMRFDSHGGDRRRLHNNIAIYW